MGRIGAEWKATERNELVKKSNSSAGAVPKLVSIESSQNSQQIEETDILTTQIAKQRRVNCTIRGTAPLLMNSFNPTAESRRDITPTQDCEERLYKYKGEVVQPATHIEKAMEKVAVGVRWENKKSYKDIIKAFVNVEPIFIKHKNPKWEPYSTSVVIKATRGRIMRHRPMFSDWELDFSIVVKNPKVEMSKIKHILQQAGQYNGLGDYRPKFGLFDVIKFETVE